MEESILTSTKEVVGITAENTSFDLSIITHTNSALSVLDQIGVGPAGGIMITDASTEWSELGLPSNILNMAKTYVFLKVRSLFDPPTLGYLISAMKEQLAEFEWRLQQAAESLVALPVVNPTRPPRATLDGQVEYVPITTYIEGGY